MRLLVVDDDPMIREVAVLALSAVGGHEVREAGSGEEAVASALADPPDAVLLDVMMPGLDGPATLALLRQHAATKDLPVVFLTAKVLPKEIERLHGLGARGVLAKPFDVLTLAGELAVLLER